LLGDREQVYREKGGLFGKPPWEKNNNKKGIDVDRFYEEKNNYREK